jgi:quercetin dioxygenase-like cupin family protein
VSSPRGGTGGAPATIGRRIRAARTELKLTLKDVEATSGFSATHISEIERGRTSPTIGALVRIAAALGKDPAFFLDAEPRGLSSLRHGCLALDGTGFQRVASTPLSAGVSGGTLAARRLDLPPGGRTELDRREEACGYVVRGRATLEIGNRSWLLELGDAFHCAAGEACLVRAHETESASLLVVTSQLPSG